MSNKFRFLFFLSFLSSSLFSQDASLFSLYGIGQVTEVGNFTSFGLGKNGIANSSNFDINLSNPAGLSKIDKTLFGFGARYSSSKASDSNSEVIIDDGNVSTIAIAFPIIPENNLSFAAGYLPVSQLNFLHSNSTNSYKGQSYSLTKEIDGGFSNGFLSFSYGIDKKNFVGLSTEYLFGSINHRDSLKFLVPDSIFYQPNFSRLSTSGSGLRFTLGYQTSLNEKIDLGLTLTPQATLTSEQHLIESIGDFPETTFTKTGTIQLPTSFGFGIVYKSNPLNFKFDFTSQNWSNFKMFGNNISVYKNSNRFTFITEYLPNTKMTYPSQQSKYYLGASYYQTPWKVNNTDINEFWLSAGASFPISMESSMNINLSYGKRGIKSIVEENIYQLSVNFLASSFWFIQIPYE